MESRLENLAFTGVGKEELVAHLYRELKKIAQGKLAGEPTANTVGATTLVHEAWMRLNKNAPDQWRDRGQFFAAASEAMRRILVEAARRRLAAKRGGGIELVALDGIDIPGGSSDERILELHQALDRLEAADSVKAQIVKLRFFSGLTNEEIASLLEVNEKTVRRQWAAARVWLYRAMSEGL